MKNLKYILLGILLSLIVIVMNSCTKHTVILAAVDDEKYLNTKATGHLLEVLKSSNSENHYNINASETIEETVVGEQRKYVYSGNSFVEKPNLFLSDEYICVDEYDNIHHLLINADTGEWIKYYCEANQKVEENISLDNAMLIADEYAQNITDINKMHKIIKEDTESGGFSVKYIRLEYHTFYADTFIFEYIRIDLNSDGSLKMISKKTADDIDCYYYKSQSELEDAIDGCMSIEAHKEMATIMGNSMSANYELNKITYRCKEIVFYKKVGVLYECTVFVTDKESGKKESFHCDFIVYSENESSKFNPFRRTMQCG